MKPKNFLYEETQFMGCTYLVELTDIGLELQRSTVCIPFTIGSDIIVKPKPKEWETFFNSVSKLNLKPKKPKDEVLDGFEVKCNVIFEEKMIKFKIINPDFENFENFRNLVNSLTICDEYPIGVLKDYNDE